MVDKNSKSLQRLMSSYKVVFHKYSLNDSNIDYQI